MTKDDDSLLSQVLIKEPWTMEETIAFIRFIQTFEEEDMKEKNNFATRFPGQKVTFNCDICGKRTRDTGNNGAVGLCPKCFKECEEENARADGFGDK